MLKIDPSTSPAAAGSLLEAELRRRLPDKIELRVGLNGVDVAPGEEEPDDLAMIALANEYGVHAPARPFFATTFDLHARTWLEGVRVAAGLRIADRTDEAMTVLRVTAIAAVANMQDVITETEWVDNSKETVRRKTRGGKRGDQPLVDTAQMLQSIRAAVIIGDESIVYSREALG